LKSHTTVADIPGRLCAPDFFGIVLIFSESEFPCRIGARAYATFEPSKQHNTTMKNKMVSSVSAALFMLAAVIFAQPVQAQESSSMDSLFSAVNKKDRIGFSVSFGSRSNRITSSLEAINNMSLTAQGGTVGVLWGNRVIETKLVAGYYYSGAQVPHSIDMIELEASARFYPLNAFTGKEHKVTPYLNVGASRNHYKMFGFYGLHETGLRNYSVSTEPYLGNIDAYYGSMGTGVEVKVFDQGDFVKLFSEVNYHRLLHQNASDLFQNTALSGQLSINVGVSFGINRFK
jgi:hypothetical protein